tara:strand:+ start:290 stop:484 length:195 start_codon:yes stop_codon:yes gene_type:complete
MDIAQEVREFNESMHNFALDIRTPDKASECQLETDFGVKMTHEEEAFYENNCKGPYTYTSTNNA